jgi:hypothetical protein
MLSQQFADLSVIKTTNADKHRLSRFCGSRLSQSYTQPYGLTLDIPRRGLSPILLRYIFLRL